MNTKTKHGYRRMLAMLLAVATLMGLIAVPAFAGQVDDYHDPSEHWMTSSNRTNQLDVNSVVTQETMHCYNCGKEVQATVWRVPEYTRDGITALSRNVKYSDGTTMDGMGTGMVNDGTPGVDATYTGYHWTKSSCNYCGTFNCNHRLSEYNFGKNVYELYDCAAEFKDDLDETVIYEYVDDTYHRKTTHGGTYCVFCYGTRHNDTSVLERHTLETEIIPQLGHQRFAIVDHCTLCDYTEYAFVAAKSVVADYYGVVDGQPHTLTVSDLSEAGVSTAIRYGNSAGSCTLTSAPNYTEEGQYVVYYEITYTYRGVSMTEDGVAYVWLRDEREADTGCSCGCGRSDCDCRHDVCTGSCCDSCGDNHNWTLMEHISATCTQLGYDRYVCLDCGKVEKRDYVNAIGHAYQSVVVRDATCETEGKIMETCRNCGDVKVTLAPKGEHQWRTYNVAATCTGPGYTVRECSVCGERHIENITDPVGHRYVSHVTAPTCTTGGFTLHVCSVCGDSYADSYTEATGHFWDDGTVLREPTCTEDGLTEYRCTICGVTMLEDYSGAGMLGTQSTRITLPSISVSNVSLTSIATPSNSGSNGTGHTYVGTVTDPTCSERGFTTFVCVICGDSYVSDFTAALGHIYRESVTAPTCTELGYTTYTCARCGDSYRGNYTNALGHSWKTPVTIAPVSCIGDGILEYECARCDEHYYETVSASGHRPGAEATCVNAQTCLDCGAVLAPVAGHDYKAVVTAPTCTELGYTTYTCSVCGDSYTGDVTAPLGHDWSEPEMLANSSCTGDGVLEYDCSRCNAHYHEAISASGHNPGPAATCGTPQICLDCGAVLQHATGHNYVETVTPATCTKMGFTTYTCSGCGNSYKSDYTEPVGHDYRATVTPPTCTERGCTTYTCANCGDSYQDEVTEAKGHRLDEGKVLTPGVCDHDGVIQYFCLDCDYTLLETISAPGHVPGPDATCTDPGVCTVCGKVLTQAEGHSYTAEVTEPTCTEMGFTTYTCSGCGDSYKSDYTNAAGHKESDWIIDKEPTTEAEGQRHKVCIVCGVTLITEAIEKLYNMATTDSKGEAVVGGYLVIVTDTDTKNPVANATVVLNRDGTISIRLPNSRILDYADQNTLTVLLNKDKTPVKDMLVVVTDKNGNYSAEKTGANGQITVPGTSGITGPDGKVTIGWTDADGNPYTITLKIVDYENGRPIEGAVVTIGKTGNITVVLPDGIDIDASNSIRLLLSDYRQNPLSGWTIIVKGNKDTESGETDGDGILTVPETLRQERHGAYIVGYPDGTFGPERNMTRAEAAAIFARLLAGRKGDIVRPEKNTRFEDIPADAWYSGYVRYLSNQGIIYGVEDGIFNPDQPITRAEFVAMAVRFFDAYGDGNPAIMSQYAEFTDVDDGYWAAEYIKDAAVYGWIKGYGDGTFRAAQEITRAEVVTIVNRLLDRTADKAYLAANLRDLNTFSDMESTHWAYYAVMEAANAHTATFDKDEVWSK